MLRTLYLTYETPPHPDAVAHAATEDEVRLVLDLLARPYPVRMVLAERLRNYLLREERRSPFDRRAVPVRRAGGLYRLVPWRLAKWLSHCLPGTDGVAETVRLQMRAWLENDEAKKRDDR